MMNLSEETQQWAAQVAEKLALKEEAVVKRNPGKIPYSAKDGVFDDWSGERIGWWTNGFWGGLLWQMYSLTGKDLYKEAALVVEEQLDAALMNWNALDHDNGFRWLPTAVAHYRVEKNDASLNRAMLAANNFLGRFNTTGQFFRAWNDFGDRDTKGIAIIDCMMNLPLLYWASDITGDPRFRQTAILHANTAMNTFIRPDGSSNHIIRFDPATGEIVEPQGGQGAFTGSSWTRGQAWAIYGFVLSYIHTKDENYLDTAKRVAHYIIANIPESGLLPVDYRQPEDITWEDSTAASITACGLIELAKVTEGRDSDLYLKTALRLLKALDENRCSWDPSVDELLEKCTAAYHDKEHEFPIIYGDYYFIEAILKLTGQELFIW